MDTPYTVTRERRRLRDGIACARTEPGSDPESAWCRAERFGIDMSVVEANLRLSVAERFSRHQATLNQLEQLRDAMSRSHE